MPATRRSCAVRCLLPALLAAITVASAAQARPQNVEEIQESEKPRSKFKIKKLDGAPGERKPVTAAPFQFEPPSLDFGVVKLNRDLEADVVIRNISEETLVILAMKPDCKCTTLNDLTNTEIAPGEAVTMKVGVEGRSYPGKQVSKVRLVFAGYGPTEYVIKSESARSVQALPAYITIKSQMNGELVLRALDNRPFRVLAVDGRPPDIVTEDELGPDALRTDYRIAWDLSRYDPNACIDEQGRPMPKWMIIETDHPDSPIVDIRVRHQCTRPEYPVPEQRWVIGEQRVVLDEIKAGEPIEFRVNAEWFRGEPEDEIDTVISEAPDTLAAVLLETERAEKHTELHVRVTPSPIHRGLLYEPIRFYSTSGHSYGLTVIAIVTE